jgi:hypothetical protein
MQTASKLIRKLILAVVTASAVFCFTAEGICTVIHTSAYHYRWFPIAPKDRNGHHITLDRDAFIECEVPGNSALKIQTEASQEIIDISRIFYTGSSESYSVAEIPVTQLHVTDNGFEIPTAPGRGHTFRIHAREPIQISLLTLVRYPKGNYWRNLAKSILTTLETGDLLQEICASPETSIYDIDLIHQLRRFFCKEASGGWSIESDVNPEISKDHLIYEILMSRRLLDREDILSRPLLFGQNQLEVRNESGSVITGNARVSISGPACVKLKFRSVPLEPANLRRSVNQVNLSLDGVPMGDLSIPVGMKSSAGRRIGSTLSRKCFIPFSSQERKDNQSAGVSVSVSLYIPTGNHTLQMDLQNKCWVAATVLRPEHTWNFWTKRRRTTDSIQCGERTGNISRERFTDLVSFGIPIETDGSADTIVRLLDNNLSHPGNHRLIEQYRNTKNTIQWERCALSSEKQYILDSTSSISTLELESFTDPVQTGFYRMEKGKRYMVTIPESEGNRYHPVRFYCLDTEMDPLPVKVVLDGRVTVCPVKSAGVSSQCSALYLKPGEHHIELMSQHKETLCDQPLTDALTAPGRIRIYNRIGEGGDSEIHIPCDGGDQGSLMRLFFKPENVNTKDVTLQIRTGDFLPKDIICRFMGSTNQTAGIYLFIPPKVTDISVKVDHAGWLNAAQPVQKSEPVMDNLRRDSAVDRITAFFRNPPDVNRTIEKISTGELNDLYLILGLAHSDDVRTAVDHFLRSDPDRTALSANLLQFYLLSMAGKPFSACRKGDNIYRETGYSEPWFLRELLISALYTNDMQKILDWSDTILTCCSSGSEVALAQACISAYQGELETALKHIESIDSKTFERLLVPGFSPAVKGDVGTHYIRLEDVLERDHTGMAEWDSGIDYMVITPDQSIACEITGPTIVRLSVRPDLSSLDSEEVPSFTISFSDGELDARFCFSGSDPDRSGIGYPDNPQIQPGRVEKIDIPILPGTHRVTVRGISGSGAIRVLNQTPRFMDVFNRFDSMEPVSSYRQILSMLGKGEQAAERLPGVLARLAQLQQANPGFFPLDTIGKHLRSRYQWKTLYGRGNQKIHLHEHEAIHSDIVRLRGALLDNPISDQPADLLVNSSQLKFRLPLEARHITVHMTGNRDQDVSARVQVFNGSLLLGDLATSDSETTFDDLGLHPGLLRISMIDGRPAYPVKITVTCLTADNEEITLIPERRRTCSVAIRNNPSTINVFGPGLIRLGCRRISTVQWNDTLPFEYHIEDQSGNIIERCDFSLESGPDFTVELEDLSGFTSYEEQFYVPIPDTGYYRIAVRPLCENNERLLIRFAGAWMTDAFVREHLPAESTDMTSVQVNERPDDESGYPFRSAESFYWNSPVPASLPLNRQQGGTWTAELGYRQRDDDSDADETEDLYGADGYSAEIGYKRYFEGYGIYLDTAAGGTLSDENSIEPVQFIRQRWDVNTNAWDLRGTMRVQGYIQEIGDTTERSLYIDGDIRKTFRFGNRWRFIPSIGFRIRSMTLDETGPDFEIKITDPKIYNEFESRHTESATVQGTVRYDFTGNMMTFARFKTMTKGNEESTLFGSVWMTLGAKGILGSCLFELSYTHRDAFGVSPDPDRDRLFAKISIFQWVKHRWQWTLSVSDRYTLDTKWNDFRLSLGVRFSAGRLLRDINPYRLVFKNSREALAER